VPAPIACAQLNRAQDEFLDQASLNKTSTKPVLGLHRRFTFNEAFVRSIGHPDSFAAGEVFGAKPHGDGGIAAHSSGARIFLRRVQATRRRDLARVGNREGSEGRPR
jgi:hypothetical protein